MLVEEADVVVDPIDVHLRHATPHAPQERHCLVLPEIRVVLDVQLLEEPRECGIGRAGTVVGLRVVREFEIFAVGHPRLPAAASSPPSATSRTIVGTMSRSGTITSTHPVA